MNQDNIEKVEGSGHAALSQEDVAMINATFELYRLVIMHRCYKRHRGKQQFTRGVIAAARSALAGLRPSAPGTNPVRIVALLAKDHALAKAAIKAAAVDVRKAKQETWQNIRDIELSDDELKNLSDESPIFQRYRHVSTLDRIAKDLRQDFLASRIAHFTCMLAETISKEWEKRNPLPDVAVAA